MTNITPSQDEIIALREQSGLTKTEIAALIYRHFDGYYRYENGTRDMPIAIFELLKIKIAALKDPDLQQKIDNILKNRLHTTKDSV